MFIIHKLQHTTHLLHVTTYIRVFSTAKMCQAKYVLALQIGKLNKMVNHLNVE